MRRLHDYGSRCEDFKLFFNILQRTYLELYLSYTSVRKAQVKITKVSTYLIHLEDFNSFPLAMFLV